MKAQGLLFDMDGTLIDSTQVAVECWLRWGGEYGVTPDQLLDVYAHGLPAEEIVARVLPPDRVPEATARINELEVAETDGITALPGSLDLLASLPADRWAVVTSATRALAVARLGAAGIDAPRIVSADDITRGKPDPEPFVAGARLLGVPPAECVVFEDAPAGIESARSAGCAVVALTTSTDALALHADAIVADLSQVAVSAADDGTMDVRTLHGDGG
ncbi:sugar-phosphatase [Murinocardiopsis flavida]|uniref:Sugar-phosphatase n=1 Tax=Murinocardiopsis flavida TaxID=645275 RepID=A0A2P8DS64_9ACTN|nr:HAD-IA family hydrolase [Murinocardiopsis flavida]PSL00052.1 sugar-phosphatase [Murinocardiopsis flavida]